MLKGLSFDDVSIIPKYSEIQSRSLCNTKSFLTQNIILETPLVSSPMDTVTEWEMAQALSDLGGIGFIHRFLSIEEQVRQVGLVKKNKSIVGAAIGVSGDFLQRAIELVNSDVDVLLIDIAHGDHALAKQAISLIRKEFPKVQIIAGSVCTSDGTKRLIEWGADAVRVGVSNGSLCETRIRTGVGVPQVTALYNSIKSANEYKIPVIADGGCRMIGDICKALALGASTVMLGSLFSGTKECPGPILRQGKWPNEKLYKSFRGSASIASKRDRGESKHVEGNQKDVPYKGRVERIINDILDGLKSSMSYVGATDLKHFRDNAELVENTHSSIIEGQPHLLLD
jgi:IMP dehydrogenase